MGNDNLQLKEAESSANLPQTGYATRVWRFLGVLFILVRAMLTVIFICPFQKENQRYGYLRIWSKKILSCLNFDVVIKGNVPEQFDGLLIMANHVSWLDVLALNYLQSVHFVAKKEIRRWPLIGKIVATMGTVFIDRSDRKDSVRISANVASRLENGGTVAIFPESTTSSGMQLLPLKAALFEAAIMANQPIQPVALCYYDEHRQRSEIPAYTESSLIQSFLQVIKMRKGFIEIIYCDRIMPTAAEDRFELRQSTQTVLKTIVEEKTPLVKPD